MIHLALWIVSAIIVGSTALVALIAITALIRWLVFGVCRVLTTPIYAPARVERFIKWANRHPFLFGYGAGGVVLAAVLIPLAIAHLVFGLNP